MSRAEAIDRDQAGRLLRAAHALDPSHAETARRLARYLYTADALEELVARFGRADSNAAETDAECLHHAGIAALLLGDDRAAEAALAAATAAARTESKGVWAQALWRLGDRAEAEAIAIEAVDRGAPDDAALQVAALALLADRRFGTLWALCMRAGARGDWTPRIAATLAAAAVGPDQQAYARGLIDRDAWLEHRSLFDPAWMRDLAASLRGSPNWAPLPRSKATVRDGRRIEAAHAIDDNAWLTALYRRCAAAVTEYIDARPHLFSAPTAIQPMVGMRPEHPALTSWVVSVRGDGHEEWHIHPDAWLSGVVYVEVPDVSSSTMPDAGMIEFGPLPIAEHAGAESGGGEVRPGWKIAPRAGDLLLFPAYLAHRTWPTGVNADRICIAFDVLRRGVDLPLLSKAPAIAPPAIDPTQRMVRAGHAISVDQGDGGLLLMERDSGQCLAVDAIGAEIWSLLDTAGSARDIAHALARTYDASPAAIERDVVDTLARFARSGLAMPA